MNTPNNILNVNYCYIQKSYFESHGNLINLLDPGDFEKQSHRLYICINIKIDGINYCIPLRNRLGNEIRKFGRIGYSVPSRTRPEAGLDFRYALVIQDAKYIIPMTEPRIPNSQTRKINNEYYNIVKEFQIYINNFKKNARKHRLEIEPLFRCSSLINYTDEILAE